VRACTGQRGLNRRQEPGIEAEAATKAALAVRATGGMSSMICRQRCVAAEPGFPDDLATDNATISTIGKATLRIVLIPHLASA